MENSFNFEYQKYDTLEAMSSQEQNLVRLAREACGTSYAPYSNFRVGAAAELESGTIVTGSNQESVVFPSGMCAERTLLYHYQSTHANDPIVAIAIFAIPSDSPSDQECYPCGGCRQVILDTEIRQQKSIKVIMCSETSATIVASAKYLLPFNFEM